MIPWWWLLPAMSVGGILGMVVLALCVAAGDADRQAERWRAK